MAHLTPSHSTIVLLELRNIGFHYPNQTSSILHHLNLTLRQGERIGIIGDNGCGKSTLLKIIMGLIKPQQGELILLGKTRRNEQEFAEIRGPIGFLFQDAEDQLFSPTVEEDIAFGPLNQGLTPQQARKQVHDTLQLLGLENYAQRLTYSLSGGEKRLIALATILAMQPTLLLLDEPTTGLDNFHYQYITNLFQKLPQSMLIVSHDQKFLTQLVDYTKILKAGHLHPNHP